MPNISRDVLTNQTFGATATLSMGVTLTGADRFLIVSARVSLAGTGPVVAFDTMDLDGTSLTRLISRQQTIPNRTTLDVWYLQAPPSGIHTLNAHVSPSTPDSSTLVAISYTGVNQPIPIDDTDQASDLGTPTSVNSNVETNYTTEEWFWGTAWCISGTSMTSNQTTQYTTDGLIVVDSNGPVALGNHTIQYTSNIGGPWIGYVGVSFKSATVIPKIFIGV